LFKEYLPIEAISKHSETVIGILLIGIGSWALVRIYIRHKHGNKPHAHFHTEPYLYTHIHKHAHNVKPAFNLFRNDNHGHSHNYLHVYNRETDHKHEHSHDHGHGHQHSHTGKLKQNIFTALGIGIVHGFAGFSHLFALLPSLALPTVWASVIYISAFALGTIMTMVIFAFILGLVAFQSVVKDKQVFLKRFTITGACLAIAVGILWIVHPI